jgi:hypothetical protein
MPPARRVSSSTWKQACASATSSRRTAFCSGSAKDRHAAAAGSNAATSAMGSATIDHRDVSDAAAVGTAAPSRSTSRALANASATVARTGACACPAASNAPVSPSMRYTCTRHGNTSTDVEYAPVATTRRSNTGPPPYQSMYLVHAQLGTNT